LGTVNYFWHSRIGGFYLGGGLGFIHTANAYFYDEDGTAWAVPEVSGVACYSNNFTFGLNTGYKFLTSSGLYFRTGAFIGMSIISQYVESYGLREKSPTYASAYFKPDLSIGYSF
jgi:hypothetical protein